MRCTNASLAPRILTIADSLGSRLGHEGSHYSVHAVLIEVVQEERLLHSLLNRDKGGRNEIYFQSEKRE